MKRHEYNVVLPVYKLDIDVAINNIPYIIKHIKPKAIVVISSNEVKKKLSDYKNIIFLDEDNLVNGLDFQNIEILIKKCHGNPKRSGWYFQQFLKMAYAFCCEEDCYLLWDADTVPLRDIEFIKDDKYILDLKSEYHKPYFTTIKKLIGIDKVLRESFICEHMIIDKDIMKELICLIEKNKNIDGIYFWEKILHSIIRKDIDMNGFSEYETYGSYSLRNYPERFCFRKLETLREGKLLFGNAGKKKALKWASESYDTISFEKSHQQDKLFSFICNNDVIRKVKLKWIWRLYKIIKPGDYYD